MWGSNWQPSVSALPVALFLAHLALGDIWNGETINSQPMLICSNVASSSFVVYLSADILFVHIRSSVKRQSLAASIRIWHVQQCRALQQHNLNHQTDKPMTQLLSLCVTSSQSGEVHTLTCSVLLWSSAAQAKPAVDGSLLGQHSW